MIELAFEGFALFCALMCNLIGGILTIFGKLIEEVSDYALSKFE